MPATRTTRKKSPARSPIHRVNIKKTPGTKTGVLLLTSEQRAKIGKVAAADFDKLHNKKQVAVVQSIMKKLEVAGVSYTDRLKLYFELRTALLDQFVAGAASSHKTTIQRVTTAARAKKSNRADKYAMIRKEFEKHSKRPKTEALQLTASAMDTSTATVRRALG